MSTTATVGNYHIRAEVSQDVQKGLLREQASRQLKGERVSLMTIAAEWLEEIAKDKSK